MVRDGGRPVCDPEYPNISLFQWVGVRWTKYGAQMDNNLAKADKYNRRYT